MKLYLSYTLKTNYFHIVIASLLILSTTEFFWYQQLTDDKELIELEQEEKSELKELEEADKQGNSPSHGYDGHPPTSLLRLFSIPFVTTKSLLGKVAFQIESTKLYLLFGQLKFHL
ncbi:hypothetical protein [Reichenbachiella sp. 5M10]|uniref:hypothetical protein n=1 Tax=Reichenbachiella sp. 5M10 TaxID=1889772 RepID=UPI001179DCF6|nr:hypothetical protein [Reichenbachiella sp. 5M10]